MKYYKKINNKFEGFYDEEINAEQLFDITYEDKIIEVEIPETSISPTTKTPVLSEKKVKKTIKVPVKTLKPNFYELSDEKWQELLDGQSSGKEIRILKTGELGLYTLPPVPDNMVSPVMDYDNNVWVEQATLEEQKKYWLNEMLKTNRKLSEYRAIELEGGTDYITLKKELAQYKNKYIDVQHAEALEIDKLKK